MSENEKEVKKDAMDDLISKNINAVKRCKYPSCNSDLPLDAQFEYCEKCRILSGRNAVALRLDPCAPSKLERGYEVINALLHRMTGVEVITFCKDIEEVYLQVCKFMMANAIKPTAKHAVQSLSEQVEAARNKNGENAISEKRLRAKADKRVKQRSERVSDISKMLGVSPEAAKKWMDEDVDF